jgi:hypothetical protein
VTWHPLEPHHAHVPPRRTDEFELRVRFDRLRVPGEAWNPVEN